MSRKLEVDASAEINDYSREFFIELYVNTFLHLERYYKFSIKTFIELPPLGKLCQISALYRDFNEDEIEIIKAFELAETPEQKAELVDCYLSNQTFFEHLIHQLSKL